MKFFFAFLLFYLMSVKVFATTSNSSCSREQLTLWENKKNTKDFICLFDQQSKGAFIVHRDKKKQSLSLGFYRIGPNKKIFTKTSNSLTSLGYDLLKFNIDGITVESALSDINQDGRKDFLLRTTHAVGGVFQAFYVDSKNQLQPLKYAFNNEEKGMIKYDLLVHSESSPLIISGVKIRFFDEHRNQGVTRKESVLLAWDKKLNAFR